MGRLKASSIQVGSHVATKTFGLKIPALDLVTIGRVFLQGCVETAGELACLHLVLENKLHTEKTT